MSYKVYETNNQTYNKSKIQEKQTANYKNIRLYIILNNSFKMCTIETSYRVRVVTYS